jgi:hypothetical protein
MIAKEKGKIPLLLEEKNKCRITGIQVREPQFPPEDIPAPRGKGKIPGQGSEFRNRFS